MLLGATVSGLAAWYLFRPERAFVDARVNEPSPEVASSVLASGRFTPRAHASRGSAQVLQLSNARRVLRFTAFETSNGPDVRVYLLRDTDARDEHDLTAKGFLDLGPLKGNIGDQNYPIPAGTDISGYRAVSIWCRRFGVNFAIAGLDAP